MHILFDNGTPQQLRRHLHGHTVHLAYQMGLYGRIVWGGFYTRPSVRLTRNAGSVTSYRAGYSPGLRRKAARWSMGRWRVDLFLHRLYLLTLRALSFQLTA